MSPCQVSRVTKAGQWSKGDGGELSVAVGPADSGLSTLNDQSSNIFNVDLVAADLSKCIQSDNSFV